MALKRAVGFVWLKAHRFHRRLVRLLSMIDRRRTTAGADAAALLEQRAHFGDLHAAEHRLERLVRNAALVVTRSHTVSCGVALKRAVGFVWLKAHRFHRRLVPA